MHAIRYPAPLLLALGLVLALSGCGDSDYAPPRKVVSVPAPPRHAGGHPAPAPRAPAPRQAVPYQPPARLVATAVPGLEGVIGATSAELSRQFGAPRLDVWEGDARKLQFAGSACVLDIFLYPAAPGREPQASHTEARRASDGRDVDRAACVSALRKH